MKQKTNKLSADEKKILDILSDMYLEEVEGHVNLAELSRMRKPKLKKLLKKMEKEGLVEYLKTQDKKLVLARITAKGFEKSEEDYNPAEGSWKLNTFKEATHEKPMLAVIVLALIITGIGLYMAKNGHVVGDDAENMHQASVINVEENGLEVFFKTELDTDDFEITPLGSIDEGDLYQIEDNENDKIYLYTVKETNKGYEIIEIENLHR